MASEQAVQAWLNDAIRGDLPALQKLIMIHHGRLRSAAGRRIAPAMRSKIDPEDILQEVYADIVRNIGTFKGRGPGAFLRWATRILESKVVDAFRFHHAGARDVTREAKPAAPASRFDILVERAAPDSLTPSRIFAREEVASLLMAALAGLSEDHRRVLELRFIRGLPISRVADVMKRSPGAVQMLSARALRQLRRSMAQLSRM